MSGRIVVFGATGYTGRLVCEALVARGEKPVLAARSESKLAALASQLGGDLEFVPADVEHPDTVRALVERGDVIVSTVGPFARFGRPAVDAAISAGASYLDSTGEPMFIRGIFERYGPAAESAGCGLVTAFGYDYVPGNLAGALALREAGEEAVRVDVAYFMIGDPRGAISGGTRASLVGVLLDPQFAYRGGRIVTERGAARIRSFAIRGRERAGFSLGASEHYGLPQVAPQLREVGAYLVADRMSRAMQGMSAVNSALFKVPGVKHGVGALTARFVQGSTGGPDAASAQRPAPTRWGSHTTRAVTRSRRCISRAPTSTTSPAASSPGAPRGRLPRASAARARSARRRPSESTRSNAVWTSPASVASAPGQRRPRPPLKGPDAYSWIGRIPPVFQQAIHSLSPATAMPIGSAPGLIDPVTFSRFGSMRLSRFAFRLETNARPAP